MSSIIERQINRIPSLVRFIILFCVVVVFIHLFLHKSAQKTKSNTNANENITPTRKMKTKFKIKSPEDFKPYYDLIIVGAGLSGAVIAEQASRRKGLTSLVIDKRDHIGGNCYDFLDEKGIRVYRKSKEIMTKKYLK